MSDALPLNVSDTDTQRIFVGLGWDPNESPTLKDTVGVMLGKRDAHHDLDLSCYYFNQDHQCLGVVDINTASNPSGSIYHSGDSVEGIGDGDDEQISVELKNLPPNIAHFMFKASIKSGHNFSEVAAPEIRLCDGYTGRAFLEMDINDKADAFVFVHVFKDASEEIWKYRSLKRFYDANAVEDWQSELGALTNP